MAVEIVDVAGRTVDGDERAAVVLHAVDRPGCDLAAGPFFAPDEHSGAHRRRAFDQRHHGAHCGRLAVQIVGDVNGGWAPCLVSALALDSRWRPAGRPRGERRHPPCPRAPLQS